MSLSHFVGIILFYLPTAQSEGNSEMPQDLALISASPGDTADIPCIVLNETASWTVSWYKEEEGKNLRRIYQSSRYTKQLQGRYSSQGHDLRISDVQRNDSGVYYCATTRLLRGTRLVISGASRRSLFVVMPSSSEQAQLNHVVPLPCVFFDADTNAWNTSGETSGDQNYITTANGSGDFSIWSVKLITSTQVPYTCSEKRNLGSPADINTASTNPENCVFILYFGVPCVVAVAVLIPLLALSFRKRLHRGNAEKPGNQIPMREIPQTEYAELRCNK